MKPSLNSTEIIKSFNEQNYFEVSPVAYNYIYDIVNNLLYSDNKWNLLDLIYFSDSMHSSFLDDYMYYRLFKYGFNTIWIYLNFKYGFNLTYKLMSHNTYVTVRTYIIFTNFYDYIYKTVSWDRLGSVYHGIYILHKAFYLIPFIYSNHPFWHIFLTEDERLSIIASYITNAYFLGSLSEETILFLQQFFI